MTRSGLQRIAAGGLAAAFLLAGGLTASGARAAGLRQTPPPGLSAAAPTISGKLVAKATGKATPVTCTEGAAPTLMVNRGLVICTEEGTLVLLQLSKDTGIFNRDWNRIGYGALVLGDRLNAWGALRDGGTRLYPTNAVQDISRGGPHLQSVTGRLVAKPDQGPSGPVICGDRDRSKDAATAVARGVVICTEEGQLVLLQITGGTRLVTHDRARVTLEDLSLGDTVTGTGTLRDGGMVMNPTVAIADANLLLRGTNSQDFIAGAGPTLTLYVLSSDQGPVQGRVLASPGEPAHVRLCGGAHGAWADLKSGETVNVNHSIFNSRTMTYVDTSYVTVVSCG